MFDQKAVEEKLKVICEGDVERFSRLKSQYDEAQRQTLVFKMSELRKAFIELGKVILVELNRVMDKFDPGFRYFNSKT